ncbi:MAG: hypothetical protein OEM01_05840 [Desulfobulbaceae bacterium]|nr:hypothetical protein [Desulfobulbaceae bacterium]
MKIKFHVIFFCAVIFFSSPVGASFDIHIAADPGRYFGELSPEHAVAFATDGTMYVAYGGDNLYLAKKPSGGSWAIETVDSDGAVGQYPSLALDSSNRPHISYYERHDWKLKYAHWNGASWEVETVDNTGLTGQYTAIALDSNDNPHISYHDFTNKDLKYAHWDGSSWKLETVDSSGSCGQWSSIAVDIGGVPHIGYYDWQNNGLKYAYRIGDDNWIPATIDSSGASGVGQHCSIALDSGNYPHFSYYDITNNHLKYAFLNKVGLTTDTIDSTSDTGRYSSITIDGNDKVHISYYDTDNGIIKYASGNYPVWDIKTVETAGPVLPLFDLFTSIAVDSGNVPHIVYGKKNGPRTLNLQHAYWAGSAWQIGTIDFSKGAVGEDQTSIALDKKGYPHISYTDLGNYRGNNALMYTHWDGTAWSSSIVDSGLSPNSYYEYKASSIALDSNGYPHISYCMIQDWSSYALKYAYWNGSDWEIETVDDSAIFRAWTSIALDNSDKPHISYFDDTARNLNYAHWTGSDWQYKVVDSSVWVGWSNSIAVDSLNFPHISYYNYNPGSSLMYAHQDAQGWHTETVDDTNPQTGWDTSLALDSMDRPHIAYFSFSGQNNLKYARWDGTQWQRETVDSAGEVGWEPSIALDNSDRPHICYYDATNTNLKYAFWNGATWMLKTVDSEGHIGKFSSIALGKSGQPHISYFDEGNMALKYAGDLSPFSWPMFLPAITGETK